MSLVSFGGPFLVLVVVRGGASPDWPPDRPLEWFTIALVLVLFVVLFVACLTNGWWFPPPRRGKAPPGPLTPLSQFVLSLFPIFAGNRSDDELERGPCTGRRGKRPGRRRVHRLRGPLSAGAISRPQNRVSRPSRRTQEPSHAHADGGRSRDLAHHRRHPRARAYLSCTPGLRRAFPRRSPVMPAA